MRTLLSINNYYYRRGGAETVFFEHNRILEKDGWRVIPFAMKHPKNIFSEYEKYFVDEIEFGSDYSMAKKIINAQKIIYSFESQDKIKELIKKYRPSIAHAHNIYHHLSPSIFSVLKKMGVPTVLTLHDLKIACPAYKMLSFDGLCERCNKGGIKNVIINKCIKKSIILSSVVFFEAFLHNMLKTYSESVDKFIVPSKFYEDKLVEWGWPREKFFHVPNFVDTGQAEMAPAECGKAYIFAGRLAVEKGVATFIKAIASENLEGWIVGTGPDESNLKQLALKLNANIQFFGHQTKDGVFDLVKKSRAMVLPSEWYENAPLSIMEAYSLGVPAIGSSIGGIPEIIIDGETGWLFESGNFEELARCLISVREMTDTEVRERGMRGSALMRSKFSALKYKEKISEIYKSLGGSNV